VLLGAAHTGSQVLEAVHVKASTSVTRGIDPLAALELLHPGNHLQLERAPVVLFLWDVLRWG
jgi:hypothetical protein